MARLALPRLWSAIALAFAVPAHAGAQSAEPWQAPTLTNTRADEDWSSLADPAERAEHWTGRFKYVPIATDVWLSLGTEMRVRSENFRNNLWGSVTAPDDGYIWLRALPYVDVHAGSARVFVQPMAAYAIGVAPQSSPIDQSGLDFLQAFAEGTQGPISLRAGRQMISLGSERLIGTRYGPNVPRAFDGVRMRIAAGRTSVNVIAVRPVRPGKGNWDDATSRDQALWGVYVEGPLLDAYYLGFHNDAAHWSETEGREVRHTLGARWHAHRRDWRWNIEGAWQFGHFAGQSISAWTLATEIGRSFPGAALSPDLTLRINAASGDSKPGDGKLGTFNALFPKGKYFGELSPIGPYNIANAYLSLGLRPGPGVSVGMTGTAYWRFSRGDGIYDIPGNLVRASGASRARFIGTQAEVAVSWQTTPELELSASLSAFLPGTFISQTGPAHTIAMSGLEANFRF